MSISQDLHPDDLTEVEKLREDVTMLRAQNHECEHLLAVTRMISAAAAVDRDAVRAEAAALKDSEYHSKVDHAQLVVDFDIERTNLRQVSELLDRVFAEKHQAEREVGKLEGVLRDIGGISLAHFDQESGPNIAPGVQRGLDYCVKVLAIIAAYDAAQRKTI